VIERKATDKFLAQAIKPEDIDPSKLNTLHSTKDFQASIRSLISSVQSKKIDREFQVQFIADSSDGIPQLILLTIHKDAVQKIHIWDPRSSKIKTDPVVKQNFEAILSAISTVSSIPSPKNCSVHYQSVQSSNSYVDLYQSCVEKAVERQNKEVVKNSVREELNAVLSAQQDNGSKTYSKLMKAGISTAEIKAKQLRFDELYAENLQKLEDEHSKDKTVDVNDQSAFDNAFSKFKQELFSDVGLVEKLQKSGLGLFKVTAPVSCRAEAEAEIASLSSPSLVSA
jgi:hypothetical protein